MTGEEILLTKDGLINPEKELHFKIGETERNCSPD